LNSIIKALTGVHGPNWLGDEFWVKVSMIIFMTWKGLGSSIILYLAGLQGIPADYYEAARIDGASEFQIFKSITVPLVSPVTFYLLITGIGWTNSLLPLIIPGLFGNVSMIFFLRQNLSSIPGALVEAAKIDGCGYFRMYYQIFLPLMKGALMTQLILWFMGIWNDYLAPTIFIQNEEWFTLQVVIRSFNSYYAVNSDYPLIMAASVLAILPTLILFFIFQRYIIESMALSGVKG
jgi:multiple sugar transport system permease protein